MYRLFSQSGSFAIATLTADAILISSSTAVVQPGVLDTPDPSGKLRVNALDGGGLFSLSRLIFLRSCPVLSIEEFFEGLRGGPSYPNHRRGHQLSSEAPRFFMGRAFGLRADAD
jgi:hypothetical protein